MTAGSGPVRLSANQVRRRGWTAPMMAELLGEPDAVVPNPQGDGHPNVRLYDVDRVVAAERTDRFRSFGTLPAGMTRTPVRSADREAERVSRLRRSINAPRLLTRFPDIDIDEVRRLAVNAYNFHVGRTGQGFPIEPHAPLAVLDRIAVNYVRHRFTSYNEGMRSIPRAPGAARALDAFRRAAYDAITEQWPDLAQECHRQRAERMTNW